VLTALEFTPRRRANTGADRQLKGVSAPPPRLVVGRGKFTAGSIALLIPSLNKGTLRRKGNVVADRIFMKPY